MPLSLRLLLPRRYSVAPVVSHFSVRVSLFVRSLFSPIPAALYLEHPSWLPYNQSWSHRPQSLIPGSYVSSVTACIFFVASSCGLSFLRASASLNRRALLASTPDKASSCHWMLDVCYSIPELRTIRFKMTFQVAKKNTSGRILQLLLSWNLHDWLLTHLCPSRLQPIAFMPCL